MTRVAMSVSSDRIAPVFDVSRRLVLVDIEDGKQVYRTEHSIDDASESRRVNRLRDLGVDELICGAISRCLAERIETGGIRIIPWIGGSVEDVLEAYVAGKLPDPQFMMPGCGGGRRQRRQGRGCRQKGR